VFTATPSTRALFRALARISLKMNSLSPKSPCVGICSLGSDGWCIGCFRTLEEITGWLKMDPARRWAVVQAAQERQARIPAPIVPSIEQ